MQSRCLEFFREAWSKWVGKFAGLARFKRLGEDDAAVIIISAGRLNCNLTCLVRVCFF